MPNGVLDALCKATSTAAVGKEMLDLYFSPDCFKAIREILVNQEWLAKRIEGAVGDARRRFEEIEKILKGDEQAGGGND